MALRTASNAFPMTFSAAICGFAGRIGYISTITTVDDCVNFYLKRSAIVSALTICRRQKSLPAVVASGAASAVEAQSNGSAQPVGIFDCFACLYESVDREFVWSFEPIWFVCVQQRLFEVLGNETLATCATTRISSDTHRRCTTRRSSDAADTSRSWLSAMQEPQQSEPWSTEERHSCRFHHRTSRPCRHDRLLNVAIDRRSCKCCATHMTTFAPTASHRSSQAVTAVSLSGR